MSPLFQMKGGHRSSAKGLAPNLSFFLGLVIGAALGVFAHRSAQAAEAPDATDQYSMTRWMTQQGLPQNTIRCLLQTRDGYLWVGTRAGLGRFDGARFSAFTLANTLEMVSDNCVALAEDRDGGLWIRTEEGLLCWKDRRFVAYSAGQRGLANQSVRAPCAPPDGGVWIGTENGLDHYHRGKLTYYTTNEGLQANNIRAVCADTHGTIWVGTEIAQHQGGWTVVCGERTELRGRRGLHRLEDGKLTRIEMGAFRVEDDIICALEDLEGNLWVGTRTEGLVRLQRTQ